MRHGAAAAAAVAQGWGWVRRRGLGDGDAEPETKRPRVGGGYSAGDSVVDSDCFDDVDVSMSDGEGRAKPPKLRDK